MTALFFGWVTPLEAGIENRPLNTDDAGTLSAHEFTSAFGMVFTSADDGSEETGLTLDLGYGITDRLEVTVQLPWVSLGPESGSRHAGIGDIQIRPEFRLWEEGTVRPEVSIAGSVKFQNGNDEKGIGSGETDGSLSGQFSKTIVPFTLHLNLGFTAVGQAPGTDLDNVIFYNGAVEFEAAEKLTLVAEITGSTHSDPTSEEDPLEILFGFLYEFSEGFTLDFGIGAGLNNASPDLRVTSGVTYSYRF